MSSLADAFGEKERARFATDNLAIGTVILTYVADTNPPKEKRLIIIGEAYDHVTLAAIYINTDLNINIFPTKDLQELNPEMMAEGREYLAHNSHVDCSRLHVLTKNFLSGIISDEPGRVLGNVSADDLKFLRGLVKSARTINAGQKKTYGLFL